MVKAVSASVRMVPLAARTTALARLTVAVFCSAPPARVTVPLPRALSEAMARVPALMVVPPLKSLVPVSLRVPLPVLIRLPAPETVLERTRVVLELVRMVPLKARDTALSRIRFEALSRVPPARVKLPLPRAFLSERARVPALMVVDQFAALLPVLWRTRVPAPDLMREPLPVTWPSRIKRVPLSVLMVPLKARDTPLARVMSVVVFRMPPLKVSAPLPKTFAEPMARVPEWMAVDQPEPLLPVLESVRMP